MKNKPKQSEPGPASKNPLPISRSTALAVALSLLFLTSIAISTQFTDPVYIGTSNTGYDPSLLVGSTNGTYGSGNAAIGLANSIYQPSGTGGNFAAGQNNQVSGTGATLGEGLIVNTSTTHTTVVGTYNETVSDANFIVGNGTVYYGSGGPTPNPSNSLIVYTDGRVVIPTPQGDIPVYDPGS